MPCFTISKCIVESFLESKKYMTELLLVFTQESNPYKVSIDKDGKIFDIYKGVGEKNQLFSYWIHLMSLSPTNFDKVRVNVSNLKNDEEIFLKICSHTKSQQKLIIHSHENWNDFEYSEYGIIVYDNIRVNVYDRDEAIIELTPNLASNTYIDNSVVAMDNSSICDAQNKVIDK